MMKVLIMPERDSSNSYPQFVEFEVEEDKVKMQIEDRTLVFDIIDFKRLVMLAEV